MHPKPEFHQVNQNPFNTEKLTFAHGTAILPDPLPI